MHQFNVSEDMGTPSMRLLKSASEQNVFFTYVCLVGNIKPTESGATNGVNHTQQPFNILDNEREEAYFEDDDTATKVERSQALHEITLQESNQDTDVANNCAKDTHSVEPNQALQETESNDISDSNQYDPKILELTRMKWLSESHNGSPDASPTLLSPTESSSSCECEDLDINDLDTADRYLSTILRLDKEHNLFGLSNMTIVGSKISSKRIKKDKAVFHQTAIVQICYPACCRHKSKSQLPSSLRCNRCHLCCRSSNCSSGAPPSCTSICRSPCPLPKPPCSPAAPICWPRCAPDCSIGLEINVKKKVKYHPSYPEKEARSPCILHKPLMARSCHHVPRCLPPANCCGNYLMPCFWSGRETAPCCDPDHCFHNPPCRKPRVPHASCHVKTERDCSKGRKPCGTADQTCPNTSCLGDEGKNFHPDSFGKDKKKTKKVRCECDLPRCAGCFVQRPTNSIAAVADNGSLPTKTKFCKKLKQKLF